MNGKSGKLLDFDIHALDRFRTELIGAAVLIVFTIVFYLGWHSAENETARLDGLIKAANAQVSHISRLLSDLSDSGGDVKIVSIKPLAPEDKGELARLPFQINMESRFVSLGAYIERIENLPRLMVIDNITIEPKEEGSRVLNSNLFLSAYVLGYGGRK